MLYYIYIQRPSIDTGKQIQDPSVAHVPYAEDPIGQLWLSAAPAAAARAHS